MNDKISKSVEPFQVFLNNNFRQCSKESIEVLLRGSPDVGLWAYV